MNKTSILAVVAIVLAVAAVGTVHAQWGGPRHHHMMSRAAMDGGPMGGGGHMGRWADRGKSMCGMARHIDGRLAFLKAELKITDDQEKLWDDYASALRGNAEAMTGRCTALKDQGGKKQKLPDRLDTREQFMEARLEALRTTNKALKPLYGALSDTQKEAADELIHGSL